MEGITEGCKRDNKYKQIPVYARVSDELKTAPSFLKRLGFVPIENNEKVMIWQIRSQQE
ncbi:hypothetical protein ACWWJF_00715 [Symbiopectobacterium sp. Eva_TO]